MHTKNFTFTLFLAGALSSSSCTMYAYKAVVIAPVADLVGSPIKNIVPAPTTQAGYESLPYSSAGSDRAACPRIHQLLFNEIVDVIEECDDEVKISISSAFYTTERTTIPNATYWTHKRFLLPVSKSIETVIPPPINFTTPDSAAAANIACLLEPVHDPQTGMTYSAGTRFCIHDKHTQNANAITVVRYNPLTHRSGFLVLDRSQCVSISSTISRKERRELFVRIIKEWARSTTGSIPYVLGGTSFCTRVADDFNRPQPWPNNPKLTCYLRKEESTTPKCGMDCSGLILRAAQNAGIPYFLKNTQTISTQLQPLSTHHALQEGDLILMRGHVIIVSDRQNNLVVEARSYEHGYGKIHELPISKIFKDMPTLEALVQAHHARIPVERIDNQGVVRDRFPHIAIMRIESVWNMCNPQTIVTERGFF